MSIQKEKISNEISNEISEDNILNPNIIIDEKAKVKAKAKILTEDLGKIFEKSICLLYNIEYDSKYKYSIEDADKLKERLIKFKEVFPFNIIHSAKNGSRYDFTGLEDLNIKLSAKTSKKDGKVCPQVIGQPSKKKFCEYFEIDNSSDLEEIKKYIENNLIKLLKKYYDFTFDCPIIYYNKNKNKLLFIRRNNMDNIYYNIDWTKYNIEFSHIKKNKKWGESSSISIDNITIGEFQIHNHRDCIKFRWAFENLLGLFKDYFNITIL